MNPPHNIYIHVPFCIAKCKYCAFFSHAVPAPDWETYCNGIVAEINHWRNILGAVDIPTIFFGGGTPSLMPIGIFERIMSSINKCFHIIPGAEITLESNPGTLNQNKLMQFQSAGVNRLSVGVQSFDDERLRFLGRIHTGQDAIGLIDFATQCGLRVSADFIYGLPQDTVQDVIHTCKKINTLGLKHCSMYELTIEPNTPFGRMNLDMPTNEAMADMYNAIDETLHIPRYEVSNYAAPGNECKHNQNVWDGMPYIGIGPGAAGRILYNGNWYEQRGNNAQFDKLDSHSRNIEMVITGLRQVRGVALSDDIKTVLDMDFIESSPGLLQYRNDNRLSVTKNGMLILDDVLEKVIK